MKIDFATQALEESLQPIRPGNDATGAPFWNGSAMSFIYAPAFAIAPRDGTGSYRYDVTDCHGMVHSFDSPSPQSPLSPVWAALPPGKCTLDVRMRMGEYTIGFAGSRAFFKAAPFTGDYPPAARSYRQAAVMALENLLDNPHVQYWLVHGEPDPEYPLYCYPSKIFSAVIDGMCLLAELEPMRRDEATRLARIVADYLIAASAPAGAPLEYMPPTYQGRNFTAERYAGQNMMVYPCAAGLSYLRLAHVTGDRKYLDAARRIGESYLRLQLPNGTWHLKVDEATGKPTVENLAAEPDIADFLWKLAEATGDGRFDESAQRIFNYLDQTLTATFNWEAQFEDVLPAEPYRNLAQHQAASLMMLGLAHGWATSPVDMANAREILRYCEDQFIFWEDNGVGTPKWHYPAVTEQFAYYVPIDASAAKMVMTFLAMYQANPQENALDLAKAKALADSITRIQDAATGRIPTLWYDRLPKETDWINCTIFSVNALVAMAKATE